MLLLAAIITIAFFAHVEAESLVQQHAADEQGSVDAFVDKWIDKELIGNARKVSPFGGKDFGNTTLGRGIVPRGAPMRNRLSTMPEHRALPPSRHGLTSPVHQVTQPARRSVRLGSSDKGTNILETTNSQGLLVQVAREGYRFIWKRLITELAPQSKNGTYVRPSYSSQGWLGKGSFPIESGRYHIYLGNPCPWCHRVALARSLNGLGDMISASYMEDDPVKASRGGWAFGTGIKKDPVFGARDLREIYDLLVPGGNYKGRCTAPLLIDKKDKRIVSTESKDIVRMLDTVVFQEQSAKADLYPVGMAAEIDQMNSWIYEEINNGVYKCGFSTDQKAYDESVDRVFRALDQCEEILQERKFLNGDYITESDVFLLPTIVRFDSVYNVLFKCSLKKISEYKGIFRWLRDMQRIPGVRKTFDLEDAKRSYFVQLFPLNPSRIMAKTSESIGLDVEEDQDFASKVLLPSNGSEGEAAAAGIAAASASDQMLSNLLVQKAHDSTGGFQFAVVLMGLTLSSRFIFLLLHTEHRASTDGANPLLASCE